MLTVQKLITVAEVDPFAATARRAELAEDERQDITVFLANNPEAGDIIPGTGGLRKLRWAGKGKGKRGGYRVVYYFFDESVPVFLLAVYPKNQRIDLSPEQKKQLTKLAKDLKAAAKAARLVRRRVAR
jgi:mRNA-degrading endonuclease RelE of RelBE toxin-antitoxin system